MAESKSESAHPLRSLEPPVELQTRYEVLVSNKLQIKMWVPTEQVGIIIGRAGATVTLIRTTTGALVQVANRVDGPEMQDESTQLWSKVTVVGNPVAAQAAYRMVAERVEEVDDVVVEFAVDKSKHHLIIGTKGKTIRHLSAKHGCRIHVPLPADYLNKVELEASIGSVLDCFVAIMDVCTVVSKADSSKDWRSDGKPSEQQHGTTNGEAKAAPQEEEIVEEVFSCSSSKLPVLLGQKYNSSNTAKKRFYKSLYTLIATLTSTSVDLTPPAAVDDDDDDDTAAFKEPEAESVDDDTPSAADNNDENVTADDDSLDDLDQFQDAEGTLPEEDDDDEVDATDDGVIMGAAGQEASNGASDESNGVQSTLEFTVKGAQSKVLLAIKAMRDLVDGIHEKTVLNALKKRKTGRNPPKRGAKQPGRGKGDARPNNSNNARRPPNKNKKGAVVKAREDSADQQQQQQPRVDAKAAPPKQQKDLD